MSYVLDVCRESSCFSLECGVIVCKVDEYVEIRNSLWAEFSWWSDIVREDVDVLYIGMQRGTLERVF